MRCSIVFSMDLILFKYTVKHYIFILSYAYTILQIYIYSTYVHDILWWTLISMYILITSEWLSFKKKKKNAVRLTSFILAFWLQALLVSGASDGLLVLWSADHSQDSRELVPKLSLKVLAFILFLPFISIFQLFIFGNFLSVSFGDIVGTWWWCCGCWAF